MLAYFDTSALVPLVIAEPTSRHCTQLWDDVDVIVTTSLAYVEVHAALAQAARHGRLSTAEHASSLNAFQTRWDDLIHIPPSDALVKRAATLSARRALRGYDAVHCATALAVASEDFAAISGDRDLLRAWNALGVATIDTTG